MKTKRRVIFSLFDRFITKIYQFLFVRIRLITVVLSYLFYISVILIEGNSLKISNNYFVILPIISTSLSYGFRGGLFSGLLALPLNLLLFQILGHPEYSPESKVIAEIFGIIFGSVLGYVSDFFNKMNSEIEKRKESQRELEKNLQIKEVLIKEIHHRVKNNLNLIKSLIQLQSNRLESLMIKEECDKLNNRIFAISMVQDLLFSQEFQGSMDAGIYLEKLVLSIAEGFGEMVTEIRIKITEESLILDSNALSSLGLVVNEVVTNALKYGQGDIKKPWIEMKISKGEEVFQIRIRDNGTGFPEEIENPGLGMKLMKSLIKPMKGDVRWANYHSGAEVLITVPVQE